MAKLSEKFIIRLKLDQLPAYQLAQHTLYKITSGIVPIQDENPTVIAVGPLLTFRASVSIASQLRLRRRHELRTATRRIAD